MHGHGRPAFRGRQDLQPGLRAQSEEQGQAAVVGVGAGADVGCGAWGEGRVLEGERGGPVRRVVGGGGDGGKDGAYVEETENGAGGAEGWVVSGGEPGWAAEGGVDLEGGVSFDVRGLRGGGGVWIGDLLSSRLLRGGESGGRAPGIDVRSGSVRLRGVRESWAVVAVLFRW